jgi:hypothetical protein
LKRRGGPSGAEGYEPRAKAVESVADGTVAPDGVEYLSAPCPWVLPTAWGAQIQTSQNPVSRELGCARHLYGFDLPAN